MRKEWVLRGSNEEKIKKMAESMNIDSFVARLLINRGIEDIHEAEKFLNPRKEDLHDPYLFKDMEKAVKIILEAGQKKDPIVIFGDYDVDGVTSTALLYNSFKELGFNVGYYIPLRLEEGYGLNNESINDLKDQGYKLIVTVDCGVTSVEEVSFAKHLGMNVVITDHHETKDSLPPADAIINPKVLGENYPFLGLAGVGVAFKLLTAINQKLNDPLNLFDFLDIVALGTIADIVPLLDENRFIVKEGTKILKTNPSPGINCLFKYLRIYKENLTAKDVAFKIAPKINAAGRMGSAITALKLLVSDEVKDVPKTANSLIKYNNLRQNIEAKIFEQAKKKIESKKSFEKDKVLVVSGDGWHLGVLGIVASRLVGIYNKPVFLVSISDGIGKGSARSPGQISLINLLNNVKNNILQDYGGHEMAAGFSVAENKIDNLRKELNEAYKNLYKDKTPVHQIEIDDVLEPDMINSRTLHLIDLLRPYGHSNPEPTFLIKGMNIERAKIFGVNGDHVKLILRSGEKKNLAIGYNMTNLFENFKYVKPSLLKMDGVINIKGDMSFGMQTVKLSLIDTNLYIDPIFDEEARDKHFVSEFIRNWKKQEPKTNYVENIDSIMNNLEKNITHRSREMLSENHDKWSNFSNIREKNSVLSWKILSNIKNNKSTLIVSGLNGTLFHSFYSIQHNLDIVNPAYANSLFNDNLESKVLFCTLPFFIRNKKDLMEKYDECIIDEPAYILLDYYKALPEYDEIIEFIRKNKNIGIVGSIYSNKILDFLNETKFIQQKFPFQIKKLGIIDNRGTRNKFDHLTSLIKHGEVITVIVNSPKKTSLLARNIGKSLSKYLQNGELIFYNYLLRDFQRSSIYSLVERKKIKVLITTPSNDGLGINRENTNVVYYSAPQNYIEFLDNITVKSNKDMDIFLNLCFNKADLMSNINTIDRLFPSKEELEVIFQDFKEVLPATENDIKNALGFEDGVFKVYLSILKEMGKVENEDKTWKLINAETFTDEEFKNTLRYREGFIEKKITRAFTTALATKTTRGLLRNFNANKGILMN
ncbi:MAG: single-stranded-DNA-specific exonuclease [Kosmotogales bacterium]|nr:single-stranded-DNA-specific exonuclease [Kosmotogales bacterium]